VVLTDDHDHVLDRRGRVAVVRRRRLVPGLVAALVVAGVALVRERVQLECAARARERTGTTRKRNQGG
jgi:hypothetical protein